ncbi:hypothetical protein [Solibacillus sp. NPDC093137]|uniref:hypothetical protein n=1 Tax=Solibacillus sp. NPDC093137 TaxID=3390678 RepID=UPI003D0782FB
MNTLELDLLQKQNIQAREELLMAVLIGNSYVKVDPFSNRSLNFKLDAGKESVLYAYLKSKNLMIDLKVDLTEGYEYSLSNSLIVEKFLRKHVDHNGEIINLTAKELNASVLMLWLCLFANKDKNESTIINPKLSFSMANLIIENYYKHFDSKYIVYLEDRFYIGNLNSIFLYSIKTNRPSIQTMEITKLFDVPLSKLRKLAKGELLNAYC